MRYIALIARVLVGIEFIFSGFVKVVDPYGTGLKLQEYFEVFAVDVPKMTPFFHFLAENSLMLSLAFCCLELILGVALLFSFKPKIVAWITLLLMLFFTFLTFYSAYFQKVTDCGCFGDFFKLKPWDSFYKDLISLFFILIIFFYRKKYNHSELGTPAVLLSTIIAFGIGIYGIRNLPMLDFLPYAKGKSIPLQMKQPDIKPDISYIFLDKSTNQELASKEYLMDTLKYKYISSAVLNQDEITPKITDFSLTDTAGNSVTDYAFEGNKMLVIFKSNKGLENLDLEPIKNFTSKIGSKKVKSIVLTSMLSESYEAIAKKNNFKYEVYSSDEKVLKTIARANPCLVLLKDGVVLGKWSINNIPTIETVNELVTNK